jgi:hypothetical protein
VRFRAHFHAFARRRRFPEYRWTHRRDSNRLQAGLLGSAIARDLSLIRHTVKKYLFRIFKRPRGSAGVELELYPVDDGEGRATS